MTPEVLHTFSEELRCTILVYDGPVRYDCRHFKVEDSLVIPLALAKRLRFLATPTAFSSSQPRAVTANKLSRILLVSTPKCHFTLVVRKLRNLLAIACKLQN